MMQDRHWAVVKWSSLGVSIGSVVVAAGLLWVNSRVAVSDKPLQTGVESSTQPEAKVEKPLIVERKGERIIWRLQAEEAKQQSQGMHLIEPQLELFTETGEVIPVRGAEAWFEPARKNIHFKGSVKARYRDWTLLCDELRYDGGQDEMVVPGSFKVSKPDVKLQGRGLRVDRKTQKLTVAHDVRVEDATPRELGGRR
ncbi:MAG: LPS export ABC transporter periplasmic protein LptC [Mariprofundaceae bacterium]|nr:LPS export ABC transporter periplasmic protein LptC [Mariprofundaceae bacterium]